MLGRAQAGRLTAARIVRSEWSKLWSLRSPAWIVGALVIAPIVLGLVRTAVLPPLEEAERVAGIRAVLESAAIGALPAAFLCAVLGLVAMGSEHSGDVISGTLIAAPRRLAVVLAKCAVVAVVSLGAALAGLGAAAALAATVAAGRGYGGPPARELAAVVGGGAVGAALTGLLGVAAAVVARSLVGAAVRLGCVLAVAPTLVAIVGGVHATGVSDLLPATAIQAVVTRAPARPFTIEGALPSTLSPGAGMLVLLTWSAGCVATALVVVRRAVTPRRGLGRRRRAAVGAALPVVGARLRARGVLRSEALKLLTLPAARWCLALTALAVVGVAALRASTVRLTDLVEEPARSSDVATAVAGEQATAIAAGIGVAQILLATLGALVVTSEFSSGAIRPALVAVPRRLVLLGAKLAVVALASLCVALLAHALAALAVTALENRNGLDAQLTSRAVLSTLPKSVGICVAAAVLGCGMGAIVRHGLATIGAIVAVVVLVPSALGPLQIAAQGTPLVWLANLAQLFPSPLSAVQLRQPHELWPQFLRGDVLQLDPDQALVVIIAWAAGAALAAMVVFRRRGV